MRKQNTVDITYAGCFRAGPCYLKPRVRKLTFVDVPFSYLFAAQYFHVETAK